MFRFVMPLLLLLLSSGSFAQLRKPAVGDVAPDFSMHDSEGRPVKLSDLKGKVVLLEFWASWSGPCRYAIPEVVKLYNEYKEKKNSKGESLEVVFVSLDVRDALWKKAIQADSINWAVNVCDFAGLKGSTVAKYGVSKLPSSFLIDAKGKIRGKDLRGGGLSDLVDLLLGK